MPSKPAWTWNVLTAGGANRRAAAAAALRLACASTAALLVAEWFALSHAYWAPMTVILVAQPTRGQVFERALARLAGTLLGALVGWELLRHAGQNALLLGLALSVWAGGCAAVAARLRHVGAYGFLLAGYTGGVVALAGWDAPATQAFAALDRVACTVVGVMAAAAVSLTLGRHTPGVTDALRRELAAFLEFMAEPGRLADRQKVGDLYCRLGDLDGRLDGMSAGSARERQRGRNAHRLLVDMVILLAGASAGMPALLAASLKHAGATIRVGRFPDPLPELPGNEPQRARATACITAWREVFEPSSRPAGIRPRADRRAVWTAFARTAAAASAATAVWWLTGWREGPTLLVSVLIFTTLFSTHQDPKGAVCQVMLGTLVGAGIGLIVDQAIWPYVAGAAPRAMVALPILAAFAYGMARPRTAKASIDAALTFLLVARPIVGQQPSAASIGHALAFPTGVMLALAAFRWLLPVDPIVASERLLRRIESLDPNSGEAALREGAAHLLALAALGNTDRTPLTLGATCLNRLAHDAAAIAKSSTQRLDRSQESLHASL